MFYFGLQPQHGTLFNHGMWGRWPRGCITERRGLLDKCVRYARLCACLCVSHRCLRVKHKSPYTWEPPMDQLCEKFSEKGFSLHTCTHKYTQTHLRTQTYINTNRHTHTHTFTYTQRTHSHTHTQASHALPSLPASEAAGCLLETGRL